MHNRRLRAAWITLNLWRVLPALFISKTCKFRRELAEDIAVWTRLDSGFGNRLYAFGEILLFSRAFINLLLNRLHRNPIAWLMIRLPFSLRESLEINMPPEKIGGGSIFSMDLQR